MAAKLDTNASVYVPSWARAAAAPAATRNTERVEKPRPPTLFADPPRPTSSSPPPLTPATASLVSDGAACSSTHAAVLAGCGGGQTLSLARGTRVERRRRGAARAHGEAKTGALNEGRRSRRPGVLSGQSTSAASLSWRRGAAVGADEPRRASTRASSLSSVASPHQSRGGGGVGGGWVAEHGARRHGTSPLPPPPSTPPPPVYPPWFGAGAMMVPGPTPLSAPVCAVCPPFVAPYTPDEQSLSRELLDFSRYVTLSPCEHKVRQDMLAELKTIIGSAAWPCLESDASSTEVGPAPRVVVYGSAALGLSICTSDLDLTLVFARTTRTPTTCSTTDTSSSSSSSACASTDDTSTSTAARPTVLTRLRALYAALLEHRGDAWRVQLLEDCRVPVLKLYDPSQHLAVDVHVCEEEEENEEREDEVAVKEDTCADNKKASDAVRPHGTTWTESVLTQQQKWLAAHPVAAPLILLTKAALRQWNMNRLYTGGLSSTAVYSLVHRFLAEHELHLGTVTASTAPTGEQVELSAPASSSSSSLPLTASSLRTRAVLPTLWPDDAAAAATSLSEPSKSMLPTTTMTMTTATTATATTTGTMSMTKSNSNSHLAWSSGASTCTDGSRDEAKDAHEEAMCSLRLTTPTPADGDAQAEAGALPYAWLDGYCQAHYHISSFARLLISLWMYLSNENFQMGYCIPDTFAALVRAEARGDADGDDMEEEEQESGDSDEQRIKRLASQRAREDTLREDGLCSYPRSPTSLTSPSDASSSSCSSPSPGRVAFRGLYAGPDLSAPSYKLPELLALFRHYAMTLEAFVNMPMSPVSGPSPLFHFHMSPLSTVFVDPRHAVGSLH